MSRGRALTAAGAFLLIAAALAPWGEHPAAVLSSFSPSGELRLASGWSALDLALKALAAAAALLLLFAAWRGIAPGRWPLRLAWFLAAVALAYPSWLAHLEPERLQERAFLHHELNRVADDMDENLVQQQTDWRRWQTFTRAAVADVPLAEPPPALWHPAYFDLPNYGELVSQVLGLSAPFLAFVKPVVLGLLVAGLALVLCGLHLEHPRGLREAGAGAVAAVVLLSLPLAPRGLAELGLIEAQAAQRRGEHVRALELLTLAQSVWPALELSWAHHQRRGELERRRDRPTSLDALLAEAYDALRRGRAAVAVQHLELARTLHGSSRLLERYLAVALSESAIELYNCGQTSAARELWRHSLSHVAVNPMAWYGLAVSHARERRYGEAASALDEVARLQGYLGYRRMVIRAQARVMASWDAFQRGELGEAHRLYSASLRPELW